MNWDKAKQEGCSVELAKTKFSGGEGKFGMTIVGILGAGSIDPSMIPQLDAI